MDKRTSMTSKNKLQAQVTVTDSDRMWDEIKDLPIDMFALPNQTVKQHVQRIKITPTELHLKLRSSSVVTSLEDAITKDARGNKLASPRFEIEQAFGYTIVKRAAQAPTGIPVKSETEEK
jgi:hypothetical protein